MLVAHHHSSVGIGQREGQAAELGALAAVGASPEASLAGVALSAVAYAQGTVHKHFKRHLRASVVDASYFVQGKFACQHHLPEAFVGEEAYFFRRAVVHLCAGVQGDGRDVQPQDAHVLHDESVYVHAPQFADELFRVFQFFIAQDGVDGDIDAHIIYMGIFHQSGDVVRRVAGGGTCPEARGTDVDGIGAMVYGSESARQVLGRCEQFYFPLYLHQTISLTLYGVS